MEMARARPSYALADDDDGHAWIVCMWGCLDDGGGLRSGSCVLSSIRDVFCDCFL